MLSPELLAAMASGCWAIGALFSANAASEMEAFAFTRWRLFFAMCLLWFGLGLSKLMTPLNWKNLLNTALSATVSMVIGMTLILQALKTGQANLVAIFSSIAPVLLLPLLWIVYRRKPASGAWWGGAMTVIGSAMIMSSKI